MSNDALQAVATALEIGIFEQGLTEVSSAGHNAGLDGGFQPESDLPIPGQLSFPGAAILVGAAGRSPDVGTVR